ncbi:unnamed protein product [Vitrella brassicaformis CCMP3155]|uniref:Uncharacterized protein n=1 Tax=Vitrella brassicaformis (strain CCMP3155) TaxID=1169540 RepID=A0A0G4FAL9_VITBC|nr:unnamed protein product [Vitrella brassicaformis CCMP3155]|eukprot:CEM09652.1 unnamed protein product [Vitrella brassicaformis CCMP3155]
MRKTHPSPCPIAMAAAAGGGGPPSGDADGGAGNGEGNGAQTEVDRLLQQIQTLQNRVDELTGHNQTLEQQQKEFEKRLEKEMEKMGQRMQQKDKEVREANERCGLLQERLALCEKQYKDATGRDPSYKGEEAERDEAGEPVTPLRRAQNEMGRMREVIAKQRSVIEEIEQEMDKLRSDREKYRRGETLMSQRLSKAKAELKTKDTELGQAHRSLMVVEQKGREYQEKLNEMMGYVKFTGLYSPQSRSRQRAREARARFMPQDSVEEVDLNVEEEEESEESEESKAEKAAPAAGPGRCQSP